MAQRSEYLVAVVGADVTQFRKSMRDIRNEFGVLAHEGRGFSETFRRLGEAMTYAITVPLTIAGAAAVGAASSFEAAMRNINSIAFLTEQQFSDLSAAVFEFGKTTRDGAVSTAEALYTIYSAGLEGEAAMNTLKATILTAEAGLASTERTAEALVSVMLSYGLTTEQEAMRASDALTRMVQVGVGSMETFAGSISTFMPSAAALGVAFEEAFAINAMFTQFGYSAPEAAVRVNAAMRSMIKPSEAMSAAFGKLGVKSTKELIAKYGSLTEAIIALRGTTDGTEEAMAKLFSDTRALQGVLALTFNIERSRATLKSFMEAVDGATMKAWAQQTRTFAYAFDKLKSSVQAVGIVFGNELLPLLTPLVRMVTNFIIGLAELDKSVIRNTIAISGFVATLGPALWLFSSLMHPVVLLGAAFVGLANAIYAMPGVAAVVVGAFDNIRSALAPIANEIQNLLTLIFGYLGGTSGVDTYSRATDGLIPTAAQAGSLSGSLTSWMYEVVKGDTLWDIWFQQHKSGGMTFADFMTAIGAETSLINPGDVLQIGGGSSDSLMNWFTPQLSSGAKPPLENVMQAIRGIGTRLQAAVDEVLPEIDTALGGLLKAIGLGFGAAGYEDENGNTPVFKFVKNIIKTLLGLPTAIEDNMPGITGGFKVLVEGIGTWLTEEGIPTVARSIGYFAGTVARLLVSGLSAAFSFLLGGGAGEAIDGVKTFAEDKIFDPLARGFAGGSGSAFSIDAAALITKFEELFTKVVSGLETPIALFINDIAALFTGTSGKDGETPIYKAIRSAFSYIFDGGLGRDLEASDISGSLGTLFSNVATWIRDEGLPTVSRSIGFLVGSIGNLLAKGFMYLATGGLGDIAKGFVEKVYVPFAEGIEDGAGTVGGGGFLENLLSTIFGMTALAIVIPKFIPIVGTMFTAIIGGGLGKVAGGALLTGFLSKAIAGISIALLAHNLLSMLTDLVMEAQKQQEGFWLAPTVNIEEIETGFSNRMFGANMTTLLSNLSPGIVLDSLPINVKKIDLEIGDLTVTEATALWNDYRANYPGLEIDFFEMFNVVQPTDAQKTEMLQILANTMVFDYGGGIRVEIPIIAMPAATELPNTELPNTQASMYEPIVRSLWDGLSGYADTWSQNNPLIEESAVVTSIVNPVNNAITSGFGEDSVGRTVMTGFLGKIKTTLSDVATEFWLTEKLIQDRADGFEIIGEDMKNTLPMKMATMASALVNPLTLATTLFLELAAAINAVANAAGLTPYAQTYTPFVSTDPGGEDGEDKVLPKGGGFLGDGAGTVNINITGVSGEDVVKALESRGVYLKRGR